MVKTTSVTPEELKMIIASGRTHGVGKYDAVIQSVATSGKAIKLSDVTSGQSWGIARKVRLAGLKSKVTHNPEAIVIYK